MTAATQDDLWIFGYGSLMWRPGFEYVDAHHGVAIGYRRSFCVYSTHHRGTHERPGLVLGLDMGGTCRGIVFRVPHAAREQVLRYLRAREQINGVYREVHLPVRLSAGDGKEVFAVAYVVERAHPSYAGRLPLALQAGLIRAARGESGPNVDYLVNTVRHAQQLGFEVRELNRLLVMVGPYFARHGGSSANCRPASVHLVDRCRQTRVLAPRLRRDARRRFVFRIQRELSRR
ncbi:MAG: gamma-glutamylcyclotransferase [Pseudomonadota bacterium]